MASSRSTTEASRRSTSTSATASAFHLWRKAGKRSAILSGRWAPLVNRRAAELGIASVIQGTPQKAEPFRRLITELGLDARQVCFVGDDLADLPVLGAVGLAACPADAAPEVLHAVHLVAERAAVAARSVRSSRSSSNIRAPGTGWLHAISSPLESRIPEVRLERNVMRADLG